MFIFSILYKFISCNYKRFESNCRPYLAPRRINTKIYIDYINENQLFKQYFIKYILI